MGDTTYVTFPGFVPRPEADTVLPSLAWLQRECSKPAPIPALWKTNA